MIYWLIIGLAAGYIAKQITPQEEKGGWVSSLIVGVIGSYLGGIIARMTGIGYILGGGLIGSLAIATGGAFLVLWIYHNYLKEHLDLPL